MYVVASKSSLNLLVQLTEISTLSKEMYSDFLRRLRESVKRKLLEIWRTNSRFLLHDNAPAHRSVFVKYFLAKNNATTLDNPACFRELIAADFYLYPRIISAVKERCFCDATDIIKNATEELKRLSQNDFQ
jgi:hypothetical protein